MKKCTRCIKCVVNPLRFGWQHTMAVWFAMSGARRKIEATGLFDADHYARTYGVKASRALRHYLTVGWRRDYNPSPRFCSEAYGRMYHDQMRDMGVDISPLEHYAYWGVRNNCDAIAVSEWTHDIVHDAAFVQWTEWAKAQQRPVLLITHNLTNTGAPIALMNMARVLKRTGCSPLIMSPVKGPLQSTLRDAGVEHIVASFLSLRDYGGGHFSRFLNSFSLILFNTTPAVCWSTLMPPTTTRRVAWLHEGTMTIEHFVCDLKEGLKHVDDIFAVSPYVMQCVESLCKKSYDYTALPYGIDDVGVAAPSEAAVVRVLFPGLVSKRKGHHLLLAALQMLSEEERRQLDITLVGATINPSRRVVKDVLHNRFANVKYIGERSHEDLLKLYDDADIVLCPSLDDPLPIVCAEAMCKAKPVVVSTGVGTASLITNGVDGYVIEKDDAKALATTLRRLIADKANLPKMGEQGRHLFEQHFSMQAFERNVRDKLLPLMGEPNAI